jgi:alpha-glucosidase (family GH31 glycosyl hydrolase)
MKRLSISGINLFVIFLLIAAHAQIRPPISPKWVFEPWVWEDSINTQKAVEDLISGYRDNKIPVGAVIIDSPWEWPIGGFPYADSNDKGYNTFVFDTAYYSQPKQLIDHLDSLNIHVILWITGNITTNCPLYDTALKKDYFIRNITDSSVIVTGFWRGNHYGSHIDFFNPAALAYWENLMDQILVPYEVDGWKVDGSDYWIHKEPEPHYNVLTKMGIKSSREYTDAFYTEFYNHTVNKRKTKGMITARPYCDQKNYVPACEAPISVNPAGWVGDQECVWAKKG